MEVYPSHLGALIIKRQTLASKELFGFHLCDRSDFSQFFQVNLCRVPNNGKEFRLRFDLFVVEIREEFDLSGSKCLVAFLSRIHVESQGSYVIYERWSRAIAYGVGPVSTQDRCMS